MKILIFIILAILVTLSCNHQAIPHIHHKHAPEYAGIDPNLQPLVDEYIDLAKKRRLAFKKHITAGFKVIDAGRVIGLCTFSEKFREVDIDIPFWNKSEGPQRRILVFHELTHCLCGRGHDYGKDKDYPSDFLGKMLEDFLFRVPFRSSVKPGFFADGCGMSIMTPEIASEDCIEEHEAEYLEEMFDRCEPY